MLYHGCRAHGATPLPMLGYQGSVRHYDIPLPDYTYWGNEHMYLQVSVCVWGGVCVKIPEA